MTMYAQLIILYPSSLREFGVRENLKHKGKSDSLLSVMLQCKSVTPDSDDAFVRSVVAAPEPMAVLCTNQLSDMLWFLTNASCFTVMGVDPTFNFGDFNVTPTINSWSTVKKDILQSFWATFSFISRKSFLHITFSFLL